LTSFIRVLDRQDGQLVGYLSDLTTGGALMISDKFLYSPNHLLDQELRAEVSGNSASRVYTITYKATDRSGNSAIVSATVEVLRNRAP
jgi:hypothetical protein